MFSKLAGRASALILLAACAPPPPSEEATPRGETIAARHASLSAEIAETGSPPLCARHQLGADPLLVLMIEAELALRGAGDCVATGLGAPAGAGTYPRGEPAASDRDCADFESGAAAQRAFLAAGGPAFDPYDLDRDGDGAACEWGVERARLAAPPRQPKAARLYLRGPRGGCYTYTSSGRKRYVSRDLC